MEAVSALRLERVRRGLTQEDLYLLTDRQLHPSRVSRIERGIVEPTEEDLRLLARALNTSVAEISALYPGGEN
jgi:transcriptional regulator with XRE-family HTH domain